MTLPEDINTTIEQTFASDADKNYVAEKMCSLFTASLNVGPAQLARCILYLANGKVEIVEEIFASGFYGDPRDLIVQAMDKSDHKINWGELR